MNAWDVYPENYRQKEVEAVLRAVRGGESVSVVGLSGAGKSNLLGFLAHRVGWNGRFILADGNRMPDPSAGDLLKLLAGSIGMKAGADPFVDLEAAVERAPQPVCFLLDRYDALPEGHQPAAAARLRALRDAFKYKLTLVIATRRPLDVGSELAELVFGHTFFLGPMAGPDVDWNVRRYAERLSLGWDASTSLAMRRLSGGYPALLRAICEAHAAGCPLDLPSLRQHPAVQRRVAEFWQDGPSLELLRLSGLGNIRLLQEPGPAIRTVGLTAKEKTLLAQLEAHAGQVCEKDALIQALWPEDAVFETGVRDNSLAQVVTRLRRKLAAYPQNRYQIHSVPGRGYTLLARQEE